MSKNYIMFKPHKEIAHNAQYYFFDDIDPDQKEKALKVVQNTQALSHPSYTVAIWKKIYAQDWEFIPEVGEYVQPIFRHVN